MANLKRQTTAVDGVKATEELTQTALHYSAMARRHMGVSFTDRTRMPTIHIRHMNNFVKACVLDTAARAVCTPLDPSGGLVVADIACGRGQDGPKFRYAAEAAGRHVAKYYAMDLAAENVESARLMAEEYLRVRAAVEVRVQVGDMCDPGAYAFIPDGAVDIMTCQLALHYLFRDREGLGVFLRQAQRVLKPRGLLVVSYTDGRAIVRRGRNELGAGLAADLTDVTPITYETQFYRFTIPAGHLKARLPGPYGLQYVFSLPGSVEDVPEYLVHEGLLWRAAGDHGFRCGASLTFDEAARLFISRPRFREVATKMKCDAAVFEDMDAVDVASLYRINVFSKDEGAVRGWDRCVST